MTPAIAAGMAAAAVLAALVAVLLARRALARRLASVSARLGGGGSLEGGGLEEAIGVLERAADEITSRVSEADAAAERLVASLGVVGDGVVVADEKGDIVFQNDVASELLGDRSAAAIFAGAVDRLLAAAIRGQAQRESLELFGPPRRSLLVSSHPLEGAGRVVGAVAVVENVTEKRRLDSVRRDFVANISHELKTPVGALGLLAETLLSESDPDTVRRFASRMQVEAERVAKIIDDLLDLSRIEASEGPVREPVVLQHVVGEAVERVRAVAEHRGVALDIGVVGRALRVLGDRRQLLSAVHNLLDNAVKYSDDGGKVSLRVRLVDEWIEVAVRDQGPGIPTRDLERIFERFYRVDRARARDTGGTGLGLSIVRHVAQNHGGDIRVSSKEGRGSTFTLRLPAAGGSMITAEAG